MTTYTRAQYNQICATAGFTGDAVYQAAAIAWRESRGNPQVRDNPIPVNGCNGKGSHHATGMFQFVPSCFPQFDAARLKSDPLYAAQCAVKIAGPDGAHFSPTWNLGHTWTTGTDVPAQRAAGHAAPLKDAGVIADSLGPGAAGAAQDIASAVSDPLQAVLGTLGSIAGFFALLGRWHTWLVVLEVVGGTALIVAGLAAINKDQQIV